MPTLGQSQEPAQKRRFEDPIISDSVDLIVGNPAMDGLVAVVGSGPITDGGPGPFPDGGGFD